jgi:hypothetical protein
MKRKALLTIIALVALISCATGASAQKDKLKNPNPNPETGEQMERQIAASSNVVLTLCMRSGDIQVRGWDRPEVKVIATSVRQLELQGGGLNPSQRVDVVLSNRLRNTGGEPLASDCRGVTDLQINVPRGATIEIKTHAGDIDVSQVGTARITNMSGDISLSNVTRGVEATTLSGDVSLMNSSGRVSLRSISGDVDASDILTTDASDDFTAHSTSGDINLENVAQARLSAATTSGMITLTGRLARRGSYDLNTFSGDVVLNIPEDSAFRLSARTQQGSITTEFAVRSTEDTASRNPVDNRRLTGVYGAAEWSNVNINSFNGTVRLQKR